MSAIIFYHAHCPDGLTAAAVTRNALSELKNIPKDEVACHPIHYGDSIILPLTLPSPLEHVYFVDFCPSQAQLGKVVDRLWPSIPITIIDHHAPQQEVGEALSRDYPLVSFVFDNDESGASLCARHFYGDDAPIVQADIIQDIRDIDLWRWQRTDSYGMTVLVGQKNSLDLIDALMTEQGYQHYLSTARALSEFHQTLAHTQGKSSMLAAVLILNSRDGELLWSSEGLIPVLATDVMTASLAVNRAINHHRNDTQIDIGIGFHTIVDKESGNAHIKLSVRGNGKDSTLPVTKCLGGGGHRNASGATASRIDIRADENRVIIYA